MKIQHQLKATLDARVSAIPVQEGQQVASRTVLMTLGDP
jgi:biotin carboxyl carrier protein